MRAKKCEKFGDKLPDGFKVPEGDLMICSCKPCTEPEPCKDAFILLCSKCGKDCWATMDMIANINKHGCAILCVDCTEKFIDHVMAEDAAVPPRLVPNRAAQDKLNRLARKDTRIN